MRIRSTRPSLIKHGKRLATRTVTVAALGTAVLGSVAAGHGTSTSAAAPPTRWVSAAERSALTVASPAPVTRTAPDPGARGWGQGGRWGSGDAPRPVVVVPVTPGHTPPGPAVPPAPVTGAEAGKPGNGHGGQGSAPSNRGQGDSSSSSAPASSAPTPVPSDQGQTPGNSGLGGGDQGQGPASTVPSIDPGHVPAGHPTGDPWRHHMPGPGGSGQAGGPIPTPVPAPAPAPAPGPGGSSTGGSGSTPTPVTVTHTPSAPTPAVTPPVSTPTVVSTPSTGKPPSSGHSTSPGLVSVAVRKARKPAPTIPGILAAGRGGLLLTILGSGQGARAATAAFGSTADTVQGEAAATQPGSGGGSHAGTTRHQSPSSHSGSTQGFTAPVMWVPQLIKVVPGTVWLALAAALGLAALGCGAAVFFGRRARRQAGQIAEVAAAALTDPLTGVLNRRGFMDAVEGEFDRAQRYGRPFVIAYADVRGLKGVNDTEGHLAGDQVLEAVAAVLTSCARASDVVARLGGDEFGLLLPEQSPEDAPALLERIETQLHAARMELGLAARWNLTVGTSSYPADGVTPDELLDTADRRLYEQRGIGLTGSSR